MATSIAELPNSKSRGADLNKPCPNPRCGGTEIEMN